jgi:UDPglucose 6-dehydrogenase
LLHGEGAIVIAFDPVANVTGLENIKHAKDPVEACSGASALVVLTEWAEFSELDPEIVRSEMDQGAAVFDTRGVLDKQRWKAAFKNFRSVGESPV